MAIPKDLYDRQAQKLMQSHHCGVVPVGDCLYGYSDTLGLLCQDFKTGKEKWSERNKIDGKCAVSSADGCLYLLTEEGEAVLLRASPADWEEHGRFSLPALSPSRQTRPTHAQTKSWAHPVVANGGLYLRDQEFIYCYDVRAGSMQKRVAFNMGNGVPCPRLCVGMECRLLPKKRQCLRQWALDRCGLTESHCRW